jgi:molybdopterin converting factor small subunit
MPTVRLPTPLRPYADGQTEISLEGATVGEVLGSLTGRYPALKQHLFQDGKLRSFVNVYINDEDIRHLQDAGTKLAADDEIMIIPSIAGGA